MSEDSIGRAPASGVLSQREADLAHRGAVWKALWTQNPARTSRLQAPWYWCHCESEFKVEIPVYSKKEIPVQNGGWRE